MTGTVRRTAAKASTTTPGQSEETDEIAQWMRAQNARLAAEIGFSAPVSRGSPKTECGARTRAGGSCKRQPMVNGRCRNHGGCSTGPRTEEGKRRFAEAHRRWHAERRAAQAASLTP